MGDLLCHLMPVAQIDLAFFQMQLPADNGRKILLFQFYLGITAFDFCRKHVGFGAVAGFIHLLLLLYFCSSRLNLKGLIFYFHSADLSRIPLGIKGLADCGPGIKLVDICSFYLALFAGYITNLFSAIPESSFDSYGNIEGVIILAAPVRFN